MNTRARKTVKLSLLTICAILSLACASQESKTSGGTPVLSGPPNTMYPMPPAGTGASAIEMGWTLPDGNRMKLSDFRGQVLVLDFYATWCVPCRQSIPHLIELQQRTGSQGLQVVGLNVGGPDDRVKVPAFANELNIHYPLGFPDKSLSDFFLSDADAIPQTFVFDRNGQLVKRFIGFDDSTAHHLEQAAQSALLSVWE